MNLLAAAIQMISSQYVDENLATATRLIEQAATAGAQLICLPENFALYGAPYQELAKQEQSANGRVRKRMASLAEQYHVAIVAGSIPVWLPAAEKSYASSFLYASNGEQLAQYNKIHLFDADVADAHGRYRESEQYVAGDKAVCVDLPLAKIGMSICYDLRFPELYQKLGQMGANIIVVPSAFTYVTGEKHWQVLLRARAIETQCYIIAANQGGQHSEKRKTYGHSMIISPDGEVLSACEMGEAIVYATLDLAKQTAIRDALPLWRHKKLI